MNWPNIDRLEHRRPRGFTETDHRRVLRICAEIRRRTYCHAWLDSARNHICLGYDRDGEPRLVWTHPAVTAGRPFMFDELCDGWSVDELVRMILAARIDPAIKDKWHRQKLEAQEADRRRRDEEFATEQAELMISEKEWASKSRVRVNGLVHN